MARPARHDRDRALRAALELFWRDGYSRVSMKELEAALDMRPGSIYAAFGSKERLFEEALRLYGARALDELEARLAEAPSPIAGLAAHVRRLGARAEAPAQACFLAKTLLDTPSDDAVLRPAAEGLMREAEAAFAAAFRDARAHGEIASSAEPVRLARRLQAEIVGLRAFAQRTDAAPEAVTQLADDIAQDLERMRRDAAKC
ncbi:MAG: helix-turn-helix domain-containing protein [Pseudomonadota bacterium]